MVKPDASQRDELTGLYSRRGFLEKFTQALGKAKASQQEVPLSLALLDVDHFKTINDTFGHVTGDHVLVAVGEVIQEQVGNEALAGRYGGGGFGVVFQGLGGEGGF